MQQKQLSTKLQPEDVVVLLGRYNLSRIERGSVQRDVDEIFVHPDWKVFNEKYDADLAIFVMSEVVDFTNLIQPVCMPHTDQLDDTYDKEAKIVGWGLAESADHRNNEFIPRETTTRTLNDSYCFTKNPQIAIFASTSTFCGGGEGGSPNSGDSGGGLFVRSGFAWTQYGIISSSLSDGFGRVQPNSFSLYTNVVAHRKWISETVKISGSAVSTKDDEIKENIEIYCHYESVV